MVEKSLLSSAKQQVTWEPSFGRGKLFLLSFQKGLGLKKKKKQPGFCSFDCFV